MAETDADLTSKISALTKNINEGGEPINLSRIYYDRAGLWGKRGDHANAVKDYLESLSLAENSYPVRKSYVANIRAMIALEFLRQDKRELAIFWAVSAVDKVQTDALNHYDFGLICSHCEFFHIAIEAFRKAIELQPENEDAKLRLGECLREVHRLTESVEVFSKYVVDHPNDAKGWYELGWTTHLSVPLKDCLKRAMEFYQRALQENPSQELRDLIERRIRDIKSAP